MDVAGRDEDVQVGPLGDPDGLHGALRVAVPAARQGGYGHAPGLLGDAVDRLEVARRGGRKAGLDHVDLEPDELAGDFELLGRGQARAGRLLAVAQGGVEDADRAGLDPRGPIARRSPGRTSGRAGAPDRRLGLAGLDFDRVEEGHLAAQRGARPARRGDRGPAGGAGRSSAGRPRSRRSSERRTSRPGSRSGPASSSRGRGSSMIRGPLT